MQPIPENLRPEIDRLPTKAAKIRKLDARGFARADIARFLNIRYQHVRNVLEYARKSEENDQTDQLGEGGSPTRWSGPVQLTVGTDGRMVIPAELRTAMEIGSDGKVMGRVVDGELRVMSHEVAIRRAKKAVRSKVPSGVSLADELIAERRAEARMEDAK